MCVDVQKISFKGDFFARDRNHAVRDTMNNLQDDLSRLYVNESQNLKIRGRCNYLRCTQSRDFLHVTAWRKISKE